MKKRNRMNDFLLLLNFHWHFQLNCLILSALCVYVCVCVYRWAKRTDGANETMIIWRKKKTCRTQWFHIHNESCENMNRMRTLKQELIDFIVWHWVHSRLKIPMTMAALTELAFYFIFIFSIEIKLSFITAIGIHWLTYSNIDKINFSKLYLLLWSKEYDHSVFSPPKMEKYGKIRLHIISDWECFIERKKNLQNAWLSVYFHNLSEICFFFFFFRFLLKKNFHWISFGKLFYTGHCSETIVFITPLNLERFPLPLPLVTVGWRCYCFNWCCSIKF